MPLSTAWTRTGRGAMPRTSCWGVGGATSCRAWESLALTASLCSHLPSPVGPGGWKELTDDLVPSCCGHSVSLFYPREEEEDKMLEAMIRKKGEAHPGRGQRLP